MAGGIAIILLLIIVVVAAVIGFALYITGGALWLTGKGQGSNRGKRFSRPEHKAPTSKTMENTHVVGTRDDD